MLASEPHLLADRPSISGVIPDKGISPSDVAALKRCPLQGTLVLLGVERYLVSSIDRALGNAIHSFLEAVGRGQYNDADEKGLGDALELEIGEQTRRIEARWYEKNLLPISRARDSAVKKKRAIRLALEIIGAGRPAVAAFERPSGDRLGLMTTDPAPKTDHAPGWQETEKKLATADGYLKGRADRLYRDPEGRLVVEDYKTGDIQQEDGTLKKDVEDQLKLYGLMVYEETGERPRLLARPLSGPPIPVEYSDVDVQDLRDEIEKQVNKSRELVAGQESSDYRYRSLAEPGDSTACIFCVYRPICSRYLSEYFPGPGEESVELRKWNCIGEVTEIEELNRGEVLITLVHRGASLEQKVLVKGRSLGTHPALAGLTIGDNIGVFNIRLQKGRGIHEEQPSTTIYKYASPTWVEGHDSNSDSST